MSRFIVFKHTDPEYLLSLILRYKVLRIPLGLTFSAADLAKDQGDVHIGSFDDAGAILATITLTDTGSHTLKMRQVAVDDSLQGKGIGSALVRYAEQYAIEQGYTLMHCHARDVAKEFYLRLGYTIVGDAFTEVGIKHYYMEKKLA